MRIKRAFTLAEVLITLTILGIVIAITTPIIMTNIDKHTWSNSLKTSVSILNNGFQQMMAIQDIDDIRDSKLWSTYVAEDVEEPNDDIKQELNNFFKIEKMTANYPKGAYALNGTELGDESKSIRFYLANSTAINVKFHADNSTTRCNTDQVFCHKAATIVIDVNGDKRPNTMGKDLFEFVLGENGTIYPAGSDAVFNFDNSLYSKWDTDGGCQGTSPESDGRSCAARVVADNYTINYN